MQLVIYILLLIGSGLAHYRGYEYRNLIEREEPHNEMDSLVECPVCDIPQAHEVCTIDKGNKKFKKCQRGTYFNEKCGNRLDCYRGPGETCTEKMENDIFGQKCAQGYRCDGAVHQCVGVGYKVDPYWRLVYTNDIYRYPIPSQNEKSQIILPKNPLMLLA